MTPDEVVESQARLHEEFHRDGYVSIPGFFDPAEIGAIRRNKDRFVREVVPTMPETEVYYDDREDAGTLKQIQNMGKHDPFFGSLLEPESKLSRLAEICLGEPAEPRNLQYFNKSPRANTPTPPHQDGYYFHLTPNLAVTMWIALEDVSPEQGCLHHVRGSHRFGMRAHGKSGTLGFSQGILDFGIPHDLENEESFPCRAGHVIAHHSLTIHWADANTSGTKSREALGAVYFARRCEVDERARDAYQARLDAELRSAGKI